MPEIPVPKIIAFPIAHVVAIPVARLLDLIEDEDASEAGQDTRFDSA